MASMDSINNGDIVNLKAIKKKLKLSMGDVLKAQRLAKDPNVSPEDAARKLLKVPESISLNDYLAEKLNDREIETIKKLMS